MKTPGHPHLDPDAVIARYQQGRREFQSRWNRLCLFHLFPSFLLFVAGLPEVAGIPPLSIVGFALVALGIVRGFRLAQEFRTCPVCGRVQLPAITTPYRQCRGCGTRLSVGVADSL